VVKLRFTGHHSPLNTTIIGPDGQTLYKVISTFKLGVRTTTITALVDVDDLATLAGKRDDSDGKPDDDGKSDLDDRDRDGERHDSDGQLA
jgi:hypothetical protein